jgi:hypothetical protein
VSPGYRALSLIRFRPQPESDFNEPLNCSTAPGTHSRRNPGPEIIIAVRALEVNAGTSIGTVLSRPQNVDEIQKRFLYSLFTSDETSEAVRPWPGKIGRFRSVRLT